MINLLLPASSETVSSAPLLSTVERFQRRKQSAYRRALTLALSLACGTWVQAQSEPPYQYHATVVPSYNQNTKVSSTDSSSYYWTVSPAGQALGQRVWINDLSDNGGMAVTVKSSGRYYGVATDGLTATYSGEVGAYETTVWGINEAGHATGYNGNNTGGAFYFDGTTATSIGTLGGWTTVAYAINEANQIVGRSQDHSGYGYAFVYDAGAETPEMVSLHVNELAHFLTSTAFGLNNNGLVVGVAQASGGETSAFVFDLSTNHANSLNVGLKATSATAINDAGTAIGWYNLDNTNLSNRGAVIWEGANTAEVNTVDLHQLLLANEAFEGQLNSSAAAINELGWVVGNTWKSSASGDSVTGLEPFESIGFLYDGSSVYALNDLYQGDLNLKIEGATAVNEHGQIGATGLLRNGSYSGRSGVVLSEIRRWDGTNGGEWDEAANWVGGEKPDAHTAGYITLGDLQVVTGPGEDTSVYALALGLENPGDAASFVLQEGVALTVIGDTRLTGVTLDASAEGSVFETGVLSGYGTVEGTVTSGWTWIDAGKTLTVSGTLHSENGILVSGSSVLNAAGEVTGALSSLAGGQVNATGNLVLGDAASVNGVTAYYLNAGEHQVTLHDANQALVWSLTLDDGTVTAANGLSARYVNGHGTVEGDLDLRGILRVTTGETLQIEGNVAGSGFLLGDVVLGEEKEYVAVPPPSVTLLENIDYSDGIARIKGNVAVLGNVSLENVDLDAVGGVTRLTISATPIRQYWWSEIIGYVPHTLSGSGDWEITHLVLDQYTSLVATGDLAVGQTEAGTFDARKGSLVDIGEHDVTLRADSVTIASLASDGGTLHADASIHQYTGHGELDGNVHFENWKVGKTETIRERSSVELTGNLTAGDAASEDGFISEGDLNIGAHTLTILDGDTALFGAHSETVLTGGALEAVNGIVLEGVQSESTGNLNPLLTANGDTATSTITGDVKLQNAVLLATSGNSLEIDGTLSGYGVVIGDISWNALDEERSEFDSVRLERSVDIEDSTARFLSEGESTVLGAMLSLAGGTIDAENGLLLGADSAVSGYGTIQIGNDLDLRTESAVLAAAPDETLLIDTNVTGSALVIGDVQVTGGHTLFDSPTGDLTLHRTVDIGDQTATIYAENSAQIVGSHQLEVDTFGRLISYAATGEFGMTGGELASTVGVEFKNTRLHGHGTVEGDLTVTNSVVEVTPGESISVNGNISGYGVVMGDLDVQDNGTQENQLASAPSGQVDFGTTGQLLDVGDRLAKVYSSEEAIFGNVLSQGGTIEADAGITLQTYEGFGTVDGDLRLANSLIVVDKDKELSITGSFTGYGIVVGETDKTIDAPTGTVYYYGGLNLGGRELTIYSKEPAHIGSAGLDGGKMVLPVGAVFGQLRGGGTIQISPGNTLYVNSLLAPGSSPGTIEIIDGNLTLMNTAVTEIEFFGIGLGEYDFLDVGGTLTLGGHLKVIFDDSFNPTLGQILPEFFDAAEVLGSFSSVTWEGLELGLGVHFDALTHQLSIVEVDVVPEPGTWALGLLGAGAFAWLRKRRAA